MKTSFKAFFILVLFLSSFFLYAGTVYMKKDENGNIIFTDTPSEGAKKIKIETPNTVKPKNSTPNNLPPEALRDMMPPTGTPGEPPAEKKSPAEPQVPEKEVYKSVDITSPKNEETIWNPAMLSVSLSVKYGDNKSGLQEGDKAVLVLDGQKVGEPSTSLSFTLNRDQVPRGEHKLQALVVNDSNTVLISSKTITIFIHYKSVALKKNVIQKQKG